LFSAKASHLKVYVLSILDPSLTYITFLYLWVWLCGTALLASFITNKLCPDASGGGIPEIKTILSGVVKPVLLSKRLITTKCVGLMIASSSGLLVGKEGPFVHISTGIY